MADPLKGTGVDTPYNFVSPRFRKELRYFLRDSMREGQLDIPAFAQNMKGLLSGNDLRWDAKSDSSYDNLRSVELENGQTLFIRSDTYRDPAGYMAVDVLPELKSDTATLAAMTAAVAQRLSDQQLDRAISLWSTLLRDSVEEEEIPAWDIAFTTTIQNNPVTASKTDDQEILASTSETVGYLVALLRYYKPNFDELSYQEQVTLIELTWKLMNEFLKSFHAFAAFLDYGALDKKAKPAVKEPQRDVQAAVLYDVDGLNYREIGERLEIPLPPDFDYKGDHQTVRKMVSRGRTVLEKAFGEEGWRERVQAMKAEQVRWWSLSDQERGKETASHALALEFCTSYEEARRWVDAFPSHAETIALAPQLAREVVDIWVKASPTNYYPPFE